MEDALLVGGDRRGVAARGEAVASRLAPQQRHPRVVEEGRERADGVRAPAHARAHHVGQAPLGREQLGARLVADDALQVPHQLREGVWARGRAEDVVGGRGVRHPIAERLVDRVLECRRAGRHRDHLGSEHLHARHVQRLALRVILAHVDRALQAHQGSGRRRGDPVLAGARLGDDPGLAQFPREQRLAEHVVDLVGARVVEVLALEQDAHTAQVRGETGRLGEQRRPPGVVGEQGPQVPLETRIGPQAPPRGLDLLQRAHQRLGDETAAEPPEVRALSGVERHRISLPVGPGARAPCGP